MKHELLTLNPGVSADDVFCQSINMIGFLCLRLLMETRRPFLPFIISCSSRFITDSTNGFSSNSRPHKYADLGGIRMLKHAGFNVER